MFKKWMAFHEKHEKIKQRLESFFQRMGTNLNTYTVCYILSNQKNYELRVSDLASILCLSNSATSRLVAKLENETGYVRREVCEIDNRGLYVILTDEGHKFLLDMNIEVKEILKNKF